MFESLETLPEEELQQRWLRCRVYLEQLVPQVQGVLVFSRTIIYWLSGHWANGVFWLPLQGDPMLLIRKGQTRAKLESGLDGVFSFRSYKELPQILSDAGVNIQKEIGVEMASITWAQGNNLQKSLPRAKFIPVDKVLQKSRAVKSEWELNKMRLAGQRHAKCLRELLPRKIKPEMTEWDITVQAWQEFLALGHQGYTRMSSPGEEIYLGAIAAGDSGNYPIVANSPVGLRGAHPALPHMGYAGKVWQKGQVLMIDTVFSLEGYLTDKTQVYWAGRQEELPEAARKAQELCLNMQQWMQERLLPGTTPGELFSGCLDLAEKNGFSEGFMGLGENKVPFVGHGIGIFVDEWPPVAANFTDPLQENMVLALEPKIGLPEFGMVGVENTFQVTAQGGVSLTGNQYGIIDIDPG